MSNIVILVGNGLSLDLREYVKPKLEDWNPSKPIGWDVYTPGKLDIPFLESLHEFFRVITFLQKEEPKISDFDIFLKGLKMANNSNIKTYEQAYNHAKLEAEMRHFLAIAYSFFQLEVDKINAGLWRWVNWFNTYKENIKGIVSFNYDLILESIIEKVGVSYRRVGISAENEGITILKPHGSIDFDIWGIVCPVGYPMKNVVLNNDCPLKKIKREELICQRTEANIVLPNEYSPQLDFQWIKPGYDWFKAIGKEFTHCIIIGLSYWECDRPEINYLLNTFSQRTKIIVANPKPNKDLMNMLEKRFNEVQVWEKGPDNID